jgi:hypothetical protein
MVTPLSISDMRIIKQALEEYSESEYAGPADLNRAGVALHRISLHLAGMEKNAVKVTELTVRGK